MANLVPNKVLVCQNVTCHQQGSEKVLAAFRQQAPKDIKVEAAGCLGHCGNGPMVVVLSGRESGEGKIWYCQVHLKDVPLLVVEHLRQKQPVFSKQFFPQDSSAASSTQNFVWLWALGFFLFLGSCIAIAILAVGHHPNF